MKQKIFLLLIGFAIGFASLYGYLYLRNVVYGSGYKAALSDVITSVKSQGNATFGGITLIPKEAQKITPPADATKR